MLQQFAQEEKLRSDGWSGLKQIRVDNDGPRNYHTNSHSGGSMGAIHDHSNNQITVGQGEGQVQIYISVLIRAGFKEIETWLGVGNGGTMARALPSGGEPHTERRLNIFLVNELGAPIKYIAWGAFFFTHYTSVEVKKCPLVLYS